MRSGYILPFFTALSSVSSSLTRPYKSYANQGTGIGQQSREPSADIASNPVKSSQISQTEVRLDDTRRSESTVLTRTAYNSMSSNCTLLTATTTCAEPRCPYPSSLVCSKPGQPSKNQIVLIKTLTAPIAKSPADCAEACFGDPDCFSFGTVFYDNTTVTSRECVYEPTARSMSTFVRCNLYFDLGDQLVIEAVTGSNATDGTAEQDQMTEWFWDLGCWGQTC